jgi:hypothetical protein
MELKPPLDIEELAQTDPVWKKVLDDEAKTPQIKLFWLWGQILEARIFVEDTLALFQANGERMVTRKMRVLPELISDPRFWKASEGTHRVAVDQTIDPVKFLSGAIEKSIREQVEKHYPERVLNQGLVGLCTIFDYFLDSSLEGVFLRNPKILYGVGGAKNIELKTVVELGSIDAVIREICTKEIRTFSYSGIAGRLDFFKTKLHIDIGKLFERGSLEDEKQKRLEGWNEKNLEEIYQRRHTIVHDAKNPISTYEDLDIIADFFTFVGFQLAILLRDQHQMLWDVHMTMSRTDRYNSLRARAEDT